MSGPDRAAVAAQIREAALLHGTFTLRSGRRSDSYFDRYRFEAEPRLLRRIAERLAPLLPADTQVLGGLELGGIPRVTVLSQVTGLPAAFLRKVAKTYGTARYAEGADLAGRQVVLIEDVVFSGRIASVAHPEPPPRAPLRAPRADRRCAHRCTRPNRALE